MKKVCIFGGTFNPPHIGHLIMANEVFHALQLDEIRFMPNAIPPHKDVLDLCSSEQRKEMVLLAIQPFPYFSIEPIELIRGGRSYTYDTMVDLQSKEPDTQFSFLIGGDMMASLESWYRIDDLVKIVQLVGVKRPRYESKTKYSVIQIEVPQIDLSSTTLRKRIASHQDVSLLIPDAVQDYIRQEKLYESR
ncbi:MAG: nicotinate-nucleotide adenylyltransferase [Paenisporosarcina sp.]